MTPVAQSAAVQPVKSIAGRGGLVDKYFYFAMGLLAAIVVAAGFGRTIDRGLIHPAIPRPTILWFHSAAFSGWVLFYILQSALVRARNVKLHRSLGWFGAALGAVMVPLGFATTIVMKRFELHTLHRHSVAEFMIVSIFDMTVFGTLFTLGILWRKKPELHRRLLFIATAGLLSAAFGRLDKNLFYVYVDMMIALGVVRDLVVDRRVHKVYLVAMPSLIVLQCFVVYTLRTASPWWMAIAHAILG
jgi:hypothetical protein